MDVRGYLIDCKPIDKPSHDEAGKLICDGYESTVTNSKGEKRGPFWTVRSAIACVHEWADEDAKIALANLHKVELAAPVIETASESVAVQSNPYSIDESQLSIDNEPPKETK